MQMIKEGVSFMIRPLTTLEAAALGLRIPKSISELCVISAGPYLAGFAFAQLVGSLFLNIGILQRNGDPTQPGAFIAMAPLLVSIIVLLGYTYHFILSRKGAERKLSGSYHQLVGTTAASAFLRLT